MAGYFKLPSLSEELRLKDLANYNKLKGVTSPLNDSQQFQWPPVQSLHRNEGQTYFQQRPVAKVKPIVVEKSQYQQILEGRLRFTFKRPDS